MPPPMNHADTVAARRGELTLTVALTAVAVVASVAFHGLRCPAAAVLIQPESWSAVAILVFLATTWLCVANATIRMIVAAVGIATALGYASLTHVAVQHIRALASLRARATEACRRGTPIALRLDGDDFTASSQYLYRCDSHGGLEMAEDLGTEDVTVFGDGSLMLSSTRVPPCFAACRSESGWTTTFLGLPEAARLSRRVESSAGTHASDLE